MNKELLTWIGIGAIGCAALLLIKKTPSEIVQKEEAILVQDAPAAVDYDEIVPLTKEQFQEAKRALAEELLRQEAELKLKKEAEERAKLEARAKDWLTDYNEARDLARALKRPVLVSFSRDKCLICSQIEKGVYRDEAAMARIGREYVPLKSYSDPKDPSSFWLANEMGVSVWPKVALIFTDGSVKWVMEPSPSPRKYFSDLERLK